MKMSLDDYLKNISTAEPDADATVLSKLLGDIAYGASCIYSCIRSTTPDQLSMDTGSENSFDEQVTMLDDYANKKITGVLLRGKNCAGVASEELENFIAFDHPESLHSPYVCLFDPIDGSSNIPFNQSIGTIFSVYRRLSPTGSPVTIDDFLQAGNLQVAAGYVLYGHSLTLVLATIQGVDGFTLAPSSEQFLLTHPGMQCPQQGNTYFVNHGYYYGYSPAVRVYITYCQRRRSTTGHGHALRYTGCFVADLHRILLHGGIFLYPARNGASSGKLRLQYECNPFAYILEKAGGLATTGEHPVLAIEPSGIHQRSAFFGGSSAMVTTFLNFSRQRYSPAAEHYLTGTFKKTTSILS